jgi:hypothetical protein
LFGVEKGEREGKGGWELKEMGMQVLSEDPNEYG